MPNYFDSELNTIELEGEIAIGSTDNYNDLGNKPQINGVELKGNKTTEELGINIPTKTSDLDNDSGFVNSSIVANPYDATSTYAVGAYVTHDNNLYKCNTAITTAEEWNAEHWTLVDVISAIPTKTSELDNDSGFITGDNYYDKTEIDTALSGKADKSDTYTKSQVDTALSGKADKSDTYTKTETDNKIVGLIDDNSTANNKAWSASKIGGELSGKASTGDLALKADKSDTYTKAQTDSAIVGLIDDTTTANNKAWSSSKITDEIINILPTGTASGAVASFNTSLALPLVSAEFAVNASQESGTPTPSTPIAINGFNNIVVDANGDTINLPLPRTIYGGFVEWEKSKLTETVVKKKFSDFSWYRGIMNTANTGRNFYIYFNNYPDYNSFKEMLCDSLLKNNITNWGALNPYEFTAGSSNYFVICVEDYASVNAMLADYGDVELTVKLKTDNVISLENLPDLPSTVIGANSISADSGDTEVEYKESINDAIAELQALFLS